MATVFTSERINKNTGKLVRQAKVFLRVDREGYLTDSQTISDVVNFDCHESVISSLKRIIASHNDTEIDCIGIESAFYYKRRVRSNRMNPVIIRTTTDVFRAIAEHPSGEVPVGVVWTKKITIGAPKVVVKLEQNLESPIRVLMPERKRKESPLTTSLNSSDQHELPEKSRKLDSGYKTYMPNLDEQNETIKVIHSSRQSQTQVADICEAKLKFSEAGNSPRTILVSPSGPVINTSSRASRQKTEVDDDSKYPYKTQYQWPDDVNCEVILNYDGISERKTLMPGVAVVVQHLLKGNYSVLSNEVASSLRLSRISGKKPLDVLEEINKISKQPLSNDIQEEFIQRAPIKYLQDAKTEIFKVMSLLNMSKSRFKQLLAWMKTLRLEEGKRGKFFLSERNNIGKGMQVSYDTNEEAAMKLNQIYKSARSTPLTKVLHPLEQSSGTAGIQTVGEGAVHPPFMYLLPTTAQPGVMNNIAPSAVPATSPMTTTVKTSSGNGLQPVPTSQGRFEVRNKSILVPVTSIQTSEEKETSTKQKIHTVPSILRKKLKAKKANAEPPPSPESTDPTPMHLFKSRVNKQMQETDDHRSNTASSKPEETDVASLQNNVLTVKQEPVDYYSDMADSNEQNQNKCLSPTTGAFENYKNVLKDALKTDTEMPQSSEQTEKQFDTNFVIKSEPVDDF